MAPSCTPWASARKTWPTPPRGSPPSRRPPPGDGGPFSVPDVPGAAGYAAVYFAYSPVPTVLLAGFDLREAHLVPISEEALDYGDPATTARGRGGPGNPEGLRDGSDGVRHRAPGDRRPGRHVESPYRPAGPGRAVATRARLPRHDGARQPADPVSRRVSGPLRAAAGRHRA